ncbi:uncharacterized protein BDW47DRAFT_105414 [Aspergillus candidus]|uniref:Uncharacterized protein n=1 Tax=Aspergillus candidus TaxID=41067 RepID=A0A2I2FC07_ASPCN|nr:hypothetical protein BDW47DRAFT_105414 [Aspergillus candidus]PLB38160.1 hypothetical protein BDW47DRAFT_105414 [Aspergillus candidus]
MCRGQILPEGDLLHHKIQQLARRRAIIPLSELLPRGLDQSDKRTQPEISRLRQGFLGRPATLRNVLDKLPQRLLRLLRTPHQQPNRFIPDLPRRHIDHAQQGIGIPRLTDNAQIIQQQLNLDAVKKPQPPNHPIRHALLPHLRLNLLRQRRRAQQDREIRIIQHPPAHRHTPPNLQHNPLRLGVSRRQLAQHGHRPDRVSRHQRLRRARGILLDDVLGGAEDGARRAVVVFEKYDSRVWVAALHARQVEDLRRSEPVDALVGVADDSDAPLRASQQIHQLVLDVVRVLELVD